MDNNSPPQSPTSVFELVTLADNMLRDCMTESNVTSLNTAIYLLAQTGIAQKLQNARCLDLLATALLTRFSYTGQWIDVQLVPPIRLILAGLIFDTSIFCSVLRDGLDLDTWSVDDNSADIVNFAGNILEAFLHSINLSDLDTAIFLYEEAILARDPLGHHPKIQHQLANAYLIRFRLTSDIEN
ncbi:hypothetical protein MVEN_01304500 [Mycena venus]|uniref:Uncharacterized protein n=1 Tax=Mycena venus TaxID=2733690 RepID=A0A8H6XXF5_9AGAR|nr:hypothetical protein MVEN_01304500 [Mycena venus]